MEFRHLRYFLAMVEEGSIQGAARRQHVAQPALSRQLRDLEEELGCVLFERHARGVRLTRAGRAFHRDALAVVQMADAAKLHARQLGQEQARRVGLGIVRTASKYGFTQRAVAAFARTHSEAVLDFVRAASPDLVEGLREGRLDLALIFERQLDPRLFGQRVIHRERYVLAAHPSHRLARKAVVHLGDLAGEPLVWLSRANNADNHDALLHHLRVHGLEPQIGHEAQSHDEQLEIVALTAGTCLTVASAQLETAPGQLVFRTVRDMELEIELSLSWRLTEARAEAAALRACFESEIRAHRAAIGQEAEPWMRTADGGGVVRAPDGSGDRSAARRS